MQLSTATTVFCRKKWLSITIITMIIIKIIIIITVTIKIILTILSINFII